MTDEVKALVSDVQASGIGQEVLGWLRAGATMAQEQAPLVAREALRWAAWSDGVWLALGVLYLAIAGVCYRWSHARAVAWVADENPLCVIVPGAGVIFVCCGMITTVGNLLDLGKVYFAPRLYLIEFFTHLAK